MTSSYLPESVSQVYISKIVFPTNQTLLKSKVQGNRLTGPSHQFNTDFCCDEKRNNRDLHRNWNDREQLSNTELNTTSMAIQVIPATHKEVHLLSRPSELQPPDASEVYLLKRPLKTMAHRYRHTEKEAHLLSGPSELQPPDDSKTQKFNTGPAAKTRIQPIHRNRKGQVSGPIYL